MLVSHRGTPERKLNISEANRMDDDLGQSMQLSPMEPRKHEYHSVRDLPTTNNRVTIKKGALFDSELLTGEGSGLSTRVTSLVGGVDEGLPAFGRAREGRGRGNEPIRMGEEAELGELGEVERPEYGASKTPKKRTQKEQKSASKMRRSQKSKGSKQDSARKKKKGEQEEGEERENSKMNRKGSNELLMQSSSKHNVFDESEEEDYEDSEKAEGEEEEEEEEEEEDEETDDSEEVGMPDAEVRRRNKPAKRKHLEREVRTLREEAEKVRDGFDTRIMVLNARLKEEIATREELKTFVDSLYEELQL